MPIAVVLSLLWCPLKKLIITFLTSTEWSVFKPNFISASDKSKQQNIISSFILFCRNHLWFLTIFRWLNEVHKVVKLLFPCVVNAFWFYGTWFFSMLGKTAMIESTNSFTYFLLGNTRTVGRTICSPNSKKSGVSCVKQIIIKILY